MTTRRYRLFLTHSLYVKADYWENTALKNWAV